MSSPIKKSMPSPCRCPITGTRWPPSGRARPARTSMSKNRPATTSTKASADGGRRAQIQPHGAGGLAKPQHRAQDNAPFKCCTTASSATSTWPGLVLQAPQIHRPHARRAGAARRRLGQVSWTRADASRSARIVFSTTGTGSGTPATATSATRASTKWISPAGAWAVDLPEAGFKRRQVRLR